MNYYNFFVMVMNCVNTAKKGEKRKCEECKWRIPLVDCEKDGDIPGEHDLCSYPETLCL